MKAPSLFRNHYSIALRAALLIALPWGESGMAAPAHHILVHGHRGARAARPENTLPAFEYAISAGVDVLELDMAVTSDNVLVVSHDPILNRDICQGPNVGAPIHRLTLAQVREHDCGALRNPKFEKQQPAPGTRMPTIDEVFDLAPRGNFEFNIETKIFPDKPDLAPPPAEFARLVFDAIARHHLEDRVIVQSFDYRTLHEMKKLSPRIRLSALYGFGLKSFVRLGEEGQARIVSPEFHLVTKKKVHDAHAAGLQVVPWTANKPRDWKKLVDAIVDAIISDDPAELIAYLKQHGLR